MEASGVLIDNRSGLPDVQVETAVMEYFVENASLAGVASSFQTYAVEGSLLARSKYRTPGTLADEIRLARELADRDDDVGATIDSMLAIAFADGMQHFHESEKTMGLFNGAAKHMNLDGVFKRLYREYLIAGQVTTVSLFSRAEIDANGTDEKMVVPFVGVLKAEQIRPIGNDMFGQAELAFLPEPKHSQWLQEFFEPSTTAARRAELKRQDPVSAVIFTGPVEIENEENLIGSLTHAYRLNPAMVQRTKLPASGEPRPPMTRNFALLEAKRLLNLMDYALLQGGMNFIVVVKKGTDERPALPEEISNLTEVVRRASRTGVIVGDHRLTVEIITPDLTELLNPTKRKLLGRKIAMALLRVPEHATEDPGQEGMRSDIEIVSKVITADRQDLRRHVENFIYAQIVKRNGDSLADGAPRIWFPKIILQGAQYFTDYVLKLRDRGDIPRKFAVEAAGFDWEAGVAQRKRELEENIDETMAPAAIPFDGSAGAGPQDNNSGRPVGSGPNNGAPGAKPGTAPDNVRPLRTINKNAGETVKAVLDEDTGQTVRVGAQTFEILAEYVDTREIGRITPIERRALDAREPTLDGPVAVIPVNPGYQVTEVRAVRLAPGLSMLLGERRGDGALVAKALTFRSPEFDPLDAEETALKWGFAIEGWQAMPELEEHARQAPPAPAPTIVIDTSRKTRKTVRRDADGNILSVDEEPLE